MTDLETNETENAEATEAKKPGRNVIIIDPNGNEVSRTAYIQELWQSGEYTRAGILAHIKENCQNSESHPTGVDIMRYQNVFQATKNIDGPSADQLEKLKEKEKADKAAAKAAAKADETGEDANADSDDEDLADEDF